MVNDLANIFDIVKDIRRARYPGADCVFLCGSIVRGEATATSDLDLVVLFPHIEAAWRETFTHAGWPVECFCHDLETAEYYFSELDRPSGIGGLTHMVFEGIVVPDETALARMLRARAQANLAAGPPCWGQPELDYSRYTISGLMDDLRGAPDRADLNAIATVLYSLLAHHVFRSQQLWSCHGKLILRRLRRLDATLALRYESAFSALFASGEIAPLLALCEEILAPHGGYLFDGFTPVADAAHRKALL